MNKYGARKTKVDGIVFDSKHEAIRWVELSYMQRAGLISDLQRQVPYVLVPKQRTKSGKAVREVRYIADFVYQQNGETVVEDAKGMRTKDYTIKWKLMLAKHGIEVKEI